MRWVAVSACLVHVSPAAQPASPPPSPSSNSSPSSGSAAALCSSDSECWFDPFAPVCSAGGRRCVASAAFRTAAGGCSARQLVAGRGPRVVERTAGHAAGCLGACLASPRCGAVEATFNRTRWDFDCTLLGEAEVDDSRRDRARSAVCHLRVLGSPMDHRLPGYLDEYWFLAAVIAVCAALLLSCAVAICCCLRARGQMPQQKRGRALQFERSLGQILADRQHNPTGSFMVPDPLGAQGLEPSPAARRTRTDARDHARTCPWDGHDPDGPVLEDRPSVRRIRCNHVPQAEVESLNAFVREWLDRGRAPRYVVAFINPRSGDQSAEFMEREFNRLLAGPGRELEHVGIGTACRLGTGSVGQALWQVAELQRLRAEARERKIHLLVCGGDGTVTWVLSEIERFMREHPEALQQQPPIGIVPMGTGNDLARSLGWGSKFRDAAHVARYVHNALEGTVVELDQWKVTLRPKSLLPPALQRVHEHGLDHVAYFQNYFSVGMDAQITHGVDLARRDSCGRCCFRSGLGKCCYLLHAPCRCCCCAPPPLGADLQVRYAPASSPDGPATMEPMVLEGEVRQFTMTNINSYGAGRVLFSSEDLARVRPDDGLLEVFTVPGPLALGLLNTVRSTKFIQARRVELTLGSGQFFQLDGEPFFVGAECHVAVEHHRKLRLLCPPRQGRHAAGGEWRGRQRREFWRGPAPAPPAGGLAGEAPV